MDKNTCCCKIMMDAHRQTINILQHVLCKDENDLIKQIREHVDGEITRINAVNEELNTTINHVDEQAEIWVNEIHEKIDKSNEELNTKIEELNKKIDKSREEFNAELGNILKILNNLEKRLN